MESWTKGLIESSHFLILATDSYANALRIDGHPEHEMVLDQIGFARTHAKPFLIIWIEPISKENEDTIRAALKGAAIAKEIRTTNDQRGVERAGREMSEYIKSCGEAARET